MARTLMIDRGQEIVEAEAAGIPITQTARENGWNVNTARRYKQAYLKSYPEQIEPELSPDAELEDLLDLARRKQKTMDRIDPIIQQLDITHADRRPHALLLAGCMQFGGRYTYHPLIRRRLNQAFSMPDVEIAFFGDDVENFQSGTFAGAMSQYEQALQPPEQRRAWELILDMVKSRTVWGMWSQHGLVWDEKRGFTYIKQQYLSRGIPFFDGMGYIRYTVGEETYHIAVSHEFPGSSMYNKTHAQKRALWQRFPNADVIVQADKHQYAIAQEDAYGLEFAIGNRASPYVTLIQIGTAKGGPDKYSIRGWEPGGTDWPWLVFYPDRHVVKATRHFEDVVMWLRQGTEIAVPDPAALKLAA
jgi:hypothetical protein